MATHKWQSQEKHVRYGYWHTAFLSRLSTVSIVLRKIYFTKQRAAKIINSFVAVVESLFSFQIAVCSAII